MQLSQEAATFVVMRSTYFEQLCKSLEHEAKKNALSLSTKFVAERAMKLRAESDELMQRSIEYKVSMENKVLNGLE